VSGTITGWLDPVDAIAAIRVAKAQGVQLLGFDAALIDGGITQPSLEDSWDYTAKAYPAVADPYGHAAAFIQERAARGLRFEVVFGG
jgi:hypothetical protein